MDERVMETKELSNVNSMFEKSVSFVRAIGILVHFRPITTECFLPGISINNGEIVVDMEKLKYPGDILHEAGHIAVVQANDRSTLNEQTIIQREQRDAEEMMVIAWSYAACIHLDIDAGFVFHDEGYKGGGSYIAESFRNGNYFGVPMLQWMGMALEKKNEAEPDKPVYPAMLQWLRN
jgi:DNA-binding XRE family transcriptional regulator